MVEIRPSLASFEQWSDTVRSALVWLGQDDPVDTLNVARAEDPELQDLTTFLGAFRDAFGVGPAKACTAAELLKKAGAKAMEYDDDTGRPTRTTDEDRHQNLREAIDQLGVKDSSKALGKWLSNNKGRIVDGHRLASFPANKHRPTRWYVETVS